MALTKVVKHLSSTPSIVDGGNATAITIDSSENVTLSEDLKINDSKNLYFGNDNDVQLYYNSSNDTFYVYNPSANGGTIIQNNSQAGGIALQPVPNENAVFCGPNGAVQIYHNGSSKLQTTSTGINVTGTITGALASTVTATTQSATDNSTKIATTAYTDAAITALVGGAPSTLDTLNEIAASINDDANYVGTVNNLIAGKAPLASPTFTGGLTLNSGHVNIDSGLSYQWGDSHERIEQSDGKIEFFTNNGESMTLSGSNLGIGDVNPADKLSIKADTGHLRLKGSTTATKGLALLFDHSNNRSEIRSDQAGVNQLDLNYYALDHHFGRNASNITMTLTDLNKVGIGTTAPDLKLHVDGVNAYPATSGTTPNGMLHLRAKTAGGSHGLYMGVANASPWGSWLQAADANNLATEYPLLLNPNGGNVGIGTNAPPYQLSMKHDSGPTLIMTRTSTNTSGSIGRIVFGNNDWDSSMASICAVQDGTNDGAKIEFKTQASAAGAEQTRFTIFRTGLSTFNGPASSVNLGGGSTGSAAIYVNSTSGHVGEMLQLLKNGSNRLTILNNGQATFAGKIVSETTDSQFFNRLFVKNGNDGLYMGQWDGSNHRIEADASRPLSIQAYNSNGIKFGIAGNTKVTIVGNQLNLNTDIDIVQTVSSGGGDYHHITHSGNEAWTWGARSGSGSNDYLDVGLSGGTKAMTWHEDGKVGIGTTAPSSLLHIQSNDSTTNDAVNMMFLTALSTGTTTTGFGPAIVFQAERNSGVNQNVGKIRSVAEVNSGTNISSGLSFETGTVGVLNESMRIRYDGKVGIGTNNPLSRLQIGNFTSSTEQLNFAVSQNGTSKIFFTDNNTTEGGFIKNTGTTYGSDFVFGGTWNTDLDSVAIRVRQNSSSGAASQWKAKMGIGTTAPIAGLEVRGFNENKDATDADDATGAEEPILMLRGANGASVSEWIHSSKATAPSGGTQTAMISWYRFDMPGGWSGTGTPGFLEIHNQMSGMHASGSACEKFYLSLPNEHGNISTAGGLQRTSISRYYSYTANVGAYTTSLSADFYYGNSTSFGYAAGAIFMKVTHASREPFFTMYAKYIGGTGASRNYPQKMHFLGTEVTNNHQPSNISSLTVYDGRGML